MRGFVRQPADVDSSTLGPILRRLRHSIDLGRPQIGNYARDPRRVGKGVTQGEFADAIGVSREWYSLLENDRAGRPSVGLIDQVCAACDIGEEERDRLLRFAISRAFNPARRFRRSIDGGMLSSFAALRHFASDVTSCGSFVEATEMGMRTAHDLLALSCVSAAVFREPIDGVAYLAVGDRARHWGEPQRSLALDARASMPGQPLLVVQAIPTVDEIRRRGPVRVNAFYAGEEEGTWTCEFEAERFAEFNRHLRMRSSVGVPLRRAGKIVGYIGSTSREKGAIAKIHAELMLTVGAILALAAEPAA